MKFLGLGVPELLIILAVVLLIFGPKNLPKLGGAIGKTMKGLRSGMKEAEAELKPAEEQLEVVEETTVEAEEEPVAKKRVVKKVVTKE
ncbi:twin-arginine translocase TatA/TatE family subunit [Eggerthellaceae bacterium zg-1084]|uniref:twin-arginine translocase TatA/TatE family subunit n=1 Tax=Berryella wangjianweii TaxID=2734634 RepID=UPI0015563C66|nr:twin-arginine translocase TatA/TatE family subunit [Berryella wangjianweii]NPD30733.1 twin-arginine translocase TatA/TatE family subunit [Berryella wangjianweii]NPD32048.1 twin-arginine translocase TatA/TatE family subunit [Eggerthellaceae bacterium zg-997]